MPLFLFEQSVMLLGALLQNYRGAGDVPIGPTSNSGPPATGQVPTFSCVSGCSLYPLNVVGRSWTLRPSLLRPSPTRPAVPLTGPPF